MRIHEPGHLGGELMLVRGASDGLTYIAAPDVGQLLHMLADYVQGGVPVEEAAERAARLRACADEIAFQSLAVAAQAPDPPVWRRWMGVVDPRTWFTRRR